MQILICLEIKGVQYCKLESVELFDAARYTRREERRGVEDEDEEVEQWSWRSEHP